MKNNQILIISNSEATGKKIAERTKLLRERDTIKVVSYIEAISVLNLTQPTLIIIYCSNSDSISIIKEIRTLETLNKVPVIFVGDTFVEDVLLYAFDNGIDDFFFLDEADSIILTRIFLTIQKSVLYKQIETHKQILTAAEIIDKRTGVYLKDKAHIILRNFFSNSIEENLENTVFMYLRPISKNHKGLNTQKITKTIQSIIRGNDILAFGRAAGYYLILYNSGQKGAYIVLNRIKKLLNEDCTIYANAAEITKSFEEMEPILYQKLKEQIDNDIEFNFLQDLKVEEAASKLEIKDETGKSFKDFKSEFFTSFEKIIAPIFYQVRTQIEDKYTEAEIDYKIKEEESRFTLTQNSAKSELIITYPSYIKVIVDIKHIDDKTSPNIRRLTYDFEDFSETTLNSLLSDMVNEFANRLSLSKVLKSK